MSNLRTRTKNRKIKRRFLKIANLFRFKTTNLDIFLQLVLLGLILSIASLFFPWIESTAVPKENGFNAFSYITGMIGYFLIFLDIFLLFVVLSNKRKENFKLNTRLFFRDNSVIILIGTLIFIFSLNIFFVMKGLVTFGNYAPGKGLIFSFVSSIIIIFSGIMENRKNKGENYSLVTNNSSDKNENPESDRNMKLPFDY